MTRSGQPAATQAFNSAGRQNTLRPMWIGRGILPLISQARHVRVDAQHRAAARLAERSSKDATSGFVLFCADSSWFSWSPMVFLFAVVVPYLFSYSARG